MDILQRLRHLGAPALYVEAADEIERLRMEINTLRNYLTVIQNTASMALTEKHVKLSREMRGDYGN